MAPVRSTKIRPLAAGESRGVCDIVPDDVLVAVDCIVPVCLSIILHLKFVEPLSLKIRLILVVVRC